MRIKPHPIAAIVTSAYLSAMLTSSIAPVRTTATFAATIDPTVAQRALQNAISGLNAAGWAAAVAESPSPSQATPNPVPVKVAPRIDPVMTDELMARLIKLAQEQKEPGIIPASICAIFKLCPGTAKMPVKMLETENPEGHFFTMPWATGSTDIVILHKHDNVIDAYLTDKTYTLRAAAISDAAGARLILNEKAAEKFKAELSLLAKEAADLPPTGTAVAGNS